MEFTVRDPTLTSGTMLYKIGGRDREGTFEGLRRYNEFFLLHETLRARFPCIPIPAVPPKKSIGNTDMIFIQQRRFYLERFFRQLSKFDFILSSNEFRAFARPQGANIEKTLENLPKLTPKQLYDRMKEATGINEQEYDSFTRDQMATKITDFNFFMKKIKPFLT